MTIAPKRPVHGLARRTNSLTRAARSALGMKSGDGFIPIRPITYHCNRASVFDCTVRDLSDTGAQLTLADVSALPPDFELEIPSKDILVQAHVMWSRGKNHGVRFVQASD